MNAQALCLNGQAILYSPPGTGKTRQEPMHPHVCVWKSKHDPIQANAPEQSGLCGPVSHAAPVVRRRGKAGDS